MTPPVSTPTRPPATTRPSARDVPAPRSSARPAPAAPQATPAVGTADTRSVRVPRRVRTRAGQAAAVIRETATTSRDLVRVVAGTDELRPAPGDKRFDDAAWRVNPLYRRLGQGYTAVDAGLARLVDDWAATGADWREVEQVRFLTSAASSVLAPTNTLLGNPAALRRAVSTRGRSLLKGAGHLTHDLLHNGGMPTQTDRSAFRVGEDLALSPGAVVARDEVAELLQYAPTTPTVGSRPLLVVPPPICRYYFLDLRPGRSFVEYAASRGIQVFMISWRNPGRDHRHWSLDTYSRRVLDAIDSVREITGSDDVNTLGFCAGGQLQSTVLNHLAATGDARVANAGFAVTMLDFDSPAPIGAFSSPALLEVARLVSRARGVLDSGSLGAVFSWMRPLDLVTNYWVSNYLMGEPAPSFDILAWNADGTNLPAGLHSDFLSLMRRNALVQPGALTVLGTAIDLSRVTVPTFVTGGVTDHLTPWQACYRTTQLVSGPSTFVLSNAGHIASLVNPPGGSKASYWTGGAPGPDPDQWRATATEQPGSWWQAWADWNLERSGGPVPAPVRQGSEQHPVLAAAPGDYVLAPAA
ncbi:MAG: Poly-beta-hydroxybutyrate polymerase domain protein [Frankiales bacterium]|nr:Poly-beta-hydroxybutyrate polymerase domain protein [Frankiales bacterium]